MAPKIATERKNVGQMEYEYSQLLERLRDTAFTNLMIERYVNAMRLMEGITRLVDLSCKIFVQRTVSR